MDVFLLISEVDYTTFLESEDIAQKVGIANSALQSPEKLCSSKRKLIHDLVFQALDFCSSLRARYKVCETLFHLLSSELSSLMCQGRNLSDQISASERCKAVIDSLADKIGPLSSIELKCVLQFHAERLLRAWRLYSYVLHHLPDEAEVNISVEVATPPLFAPLSEHLPVSE